MAHAFAVPVALKNAYGLVSRQNILSPPTHLGIVKYITEPSAIATINIGPKMREKGRDLTRSCDKNPYTHRTIH